MINWSEFHAVLQREAEVAWNNISSLDRFLVYRLGMRGFLGNEQPSGFTGPTPFYLFWCRRCALPCKDYVHGYTREGKYYVRCWQCKERSVFRWTPRIILQDRIMHWFEGGDDGS